MTLRGVAVRGGAAGPESRQETGGREIAYKKTAGPGVHSSSSSRLAASGSDLHVQIYLGQPASEWPVTSSCPRMGTLSRAALILACLALASAASEGGESGWGQQLLSSQALNSSSELPFCEHAHHGAGAGEGYLGIVAKKHKLESD